jgi:hypothetical protein
VSRRATALGLVLGSVLVASAAGAQRHPELRVEGGFASVTQRGFSPENAALLALLWRPSSEWLGLVTSANLTYAQDSLAAAQGVAALDIGWGPEQRFRTEVGAAGASFSLRSAGRGGNGNFFTRQHVVAQNYGAWVGGGVGFTDRDGVSSRSTAADIGLWQRWGPLYLSAVVTRLQSADWPLLFASGVTRDPDDETFDFRDGQLLAQLRYGPHDVAVAYTSRVGTAGTDAVFEALNWSGTLQIADRVALVGTAGRQLADPLRGLPQADIITFVGASVAGTQATARARAFTHRARERGAHRRGGGELEIRVFAAARPRDHHRRRFQRMAADPDGARGCVLGGASAPGAWQVPRGGALNGGNGVRRATWRACATTTAARPGWS